MDCLFDNDLTALIISGEPTEAELIAAWDKVYTHYCQLSGGSYNEVFELSNQINVLNAKIFIVNGTVIHLQQVYSKELVDILNNLGLKCTLKLEDTGDVLISKLNTVVTRAKKWVIEMEQLQKDLKKIRETNTEKMDRSNFDDQLEALSSHYGYHVEASRITVARMCRGLDRMQQEYIKRQAYGNR
jgi:hypothetical protein